jgi:hypothetical protein
MGVDQHVPGLRAVSQRGADVQRGDPVTEADLVHGRGVLAADEVVQSPALGR